MTDLSASPTAVALIQTAATLPIFLLAIPAGVLSDILDRRRFLIFVQLLLASVSGTLLLLSHTGALTVDYLIALTFVGGIGAALMGPTGNRSCPSWCRAPISRARSRSIRWASISPAPSARPPAA